MTSNLIAYWGLREKEREAAETMRHNLEMEDAERKANAVRKFVAETNALLNKWSIQETERHNREQEKIANVNANLASKQIALQASGILSNERIAQSRIEQEERNRVTNSYLKQKEIQSRERISNREMGLNTSKFKWQQANDVADFGLKVFNLLEGGVALNVQRKSK